MAQSRRINQLLSLVGLKLQRLPAKSPLSQGPSLSAGHQVELIGLSGVGKSYLYRKLASQLKTDWLSKIQLKQHAVHGRELFEELEAKDSTLVEYLLRKKHEAIWCRNISLWRKQSYYEFHAVTLGTDSFAREVCLPNRGFFLDEGVQRNFYPELLGWYNQCASHNVVDMQRLEVFMKGRSLIIVDASIEYIMRNLLKRHAQRDGQGLNDLLAWMPEADVRSKFNHEKETRKQWLKVAESLGVATLKLNASEEISVNQRKVVPFFESIQREQA